MLLLAWACQPASDNFGAVDCNSTNQKTNAIYQPCRQFTFQAQYWDANQQLISDQKIWMMNTGNAWVNDSTQSTLLIQYEYDKNEIERIEFHNINPTRPIDWINYEETGFIEDEHQIWFHPFRANQYQFTEVAPFPSFHYSNLSTGNEWSNRLNIHDGWGNWSNSQVQNLYRVVGKVPLSIAFGNLDNCTHTKAEAIAEFGNSTLDFWIHPDYGFIRFLYRNYKGQICNIELLSVHEP